MRKCISKVSHGICVSERKNLITESSKSSRKVFNAIQAQFGTSVEPSLAAVAEKKLGSFLKKVALKMSQCDSKRENFDH